MVCKARGSAGISRKPIKWPITPEIHELIKKAYQTMTGNGEVRELAVRIKIPRWKITRYAISQGWIARQTKAPEWSEKELYLLERHAHLSPWRIREYLVMHGYIRTCTAIVLQRKRLRLLKNLEGMSARGLSLCLGVDPHVVNRAVKTGALAATMRGTARTPQQGGDIYYIKEEAVRDYIINNINEIDIRKVDKYWLVDILTA
jgi:hypothetical protein